MMTDGSRCVVAGVDAHTRAAGCSARPPSRATRDGYEQLIAWIAEHGRIDRIGVESTGSFAAGLVRALAERAIVTVEVNQPYAHTRHRRGKSDPIDAELAARAILSAVASAIPKQTGGNVEAIRQLAVTRDSAVKARSAALNQLENLRTHERPLFPWLHSVKHPIQAANKTMRTACKAAGIRHYHPHDLRHRRLSSGTGRASPLARSATAPASARSPSPSTSTRTRCRSTRCPRRPS
jgi:integrase